MLPISTSNGCSIAKAMARAMASGEIATCSFRLLIAALTVSSVIDESEKVVSMKPGDTSVTAGSDLLPGAGFGGRAKRVFWSRHKTPIVGTILRPAVDQNVDHMALPLPSEDRKCGCESHRAYRAGSINHGVPVLDTQRIETGNRTNARVV